MFERGAVSREVAVHVELVDHLWQIWIGASSSERADIRGTSFADDDAATAALGLCRFVKERPNNTGWGWIEALRVNGIDSGLWRDDAECYVGLKLQAFVFFGRRTCSRACLRVRNLDEIAIGFTTILLLTAALPLG